jgi:hypothetical protein
VTTPFWLAGYSSEPEISLPIEAAHRPAATATAEPELEPPVDTIRCHDRPEAPTR